MAESIPFENIETGEVSNQCQYFKVNELNSNKSEEINKTIKESIDKKSIDFID